MSQGEICEKCRRYLPPPVDEWSCKCEQPHDRLRQKVRRDVPHRDMWAGGKGLSSEEVIEIDKDGVMHWPEHPWREALEGTILKMGEEIERLKAELQEAKDVIQGLEEKNRLLRFTSKLFLRIRRAWQERCEPR